MSPRKKGDEERKRLLNALRVVCGFDDNSKKIVDTLKQRDYWYREGIDIEYGPHTLKKLMFLWYYTDIAVKIARENFKKIVFIDSFSGSGLVKIKDTDNVCLGSALIPVVYTLKETSKSKKGFDEIILIDKENEKIDLLKSRLDAIKNYFNLDLKYNPLPGDSNEVINSERVLGSVNRTSYVLIFIDPEGLEPKLPAYLPLLDKVLASDIILNASWGLTRLAGTPLAKDLIEKYLGNYDKTKPIEQQLNEVFENEFGKKVGVSLDVQDIKNRPEYTIMLRVRSTSSGSPWVEGMKDFVDNVLSQYTTREIKKFLDQLSGRQRGIDSFL